MARTGPRNQENGEKPNKSTRQGDAEKSEGRRVARAWLVPISQYSAENQDCANRSGDSREGRHLITRMV